MPVTTTATHPIAKLLRERNIPVHTFAHSLDVTERLVYYWFNGKRAISPMYLARTAEFFNVPPETLTGGD